MTVTNEGGGRLNAFANEPKMEVIQNENNQKIGTWIFIVFGFILVFGLMSYAFTI